jgi:hypothetical protein
MHKNINTTTKNTEAPLDASKEVAEINEMSGKWLV